MKLYTTTIRIYRHGEFENSFKMDVEIPIEKDNDDDVVEAIMDELREYIESDFEGDEDWENGDIDWVLYTWE